MSVKSLQGRQVLCRTVQPC